MKAFIAEHKPGENFDGMVLRQKTVKKLKHGELQALTKGIDEPAEGSKTKSKKAPA